MAINKIIYGGNTLIDLSGDTVTAADLASGVTAHDRTGTQITGTGGGGGGAIVVVDETLPNGSTAKHITGVDISDTTATASDVASGKVFYTADGTQTTGTATGVTVESLSVTQNGTYTAPTGKAYSPVTVNVSGGGGGEAEEKDVNFYDYDGTRVYSYTKADFLALAAMPSNPDHSGDDIPLTSQGWNWSLADAKTYVTTYGVLEIGQMYVPTDGKTHIITELVSEARLAPYLSLAVNGTVTVDWGDGTSETITGTSLTTQKRTQHVYSLPGTYDITIAATGTNKYSFYNTTTYGILSANTLTNYNRVYSNSVLAVHIGTGIDSIAQYAFYYCCALRTVTIPQQITSLATDAFNSCTSLHFIVLPSAIANIPYRAFYYCYALWKAVLPNSIDSIGGQAFSYCDSLQSIIIPSSVTSLGSSAFARAFDLQSVVIPSTCTSFATECFYNCYTLRSISLPSGMTSVPQGMFSTCASLCEITVPSGVTSIAASAFNNCYGCGRFYIKATSPPTLANTNVFGNDTNYKIVVPDASVNDYKAADRWSTFASDIIGESDI